MSVEFKKVNVESFGNILKMKIFRRVSPGAIPDNEVWVSEKTYNELFETAITVKTEDDGPDMS